MMLVSLISYIDRNTLALLAPTILRETQLTTEEYGWIVSAFSVSYMIGNPVWGRLLDRFGLRAGMTVAVSFWTLASVSHAFARGFWGFATARAALGLGEGATFPGGLRTAIQTLPPLQRSRGIAIAYSGGSLGAIVTPLIVTPIAVWWGWRAAFLWTGMIGGAWLTLWMFVSRRQDIRTKAGSGGGAATARIDWGDARLWSFMGIYALGALPLAFVLYIAALYLNRVMGLSQADIGKLLWLPPLGWEIGYFFWGWLNDRLQAGTAPALAVYRRLLGTATALSLPLALTVWISSLPAVMCLLTFAMFVASGFIILSIGYATQVFSSGHAGLIAGLGAGAWGALVGVFMPLFGRLFDLEHYGLAFTIAAAAPAGGYLLWCASNRKKLNAGSGPLC